MQQLGTYQQSYDCNENKLWPIVPHCWLKDSRGHNFKDDFKGTESVSLLNQKVKQWIKFIIEWNTNLATHKKQRHALNGFGKTVLLCHLFEQFLFLL